MIKTVKNNEKARLKAVKNYGILDTPPNSSLDEITKLAAELLNVPIALITLVDADRIWFKSKHGLETSQIDRHSYLCASYILPNELYEIENATKNTSTIANPLVTGEFGLRFYAAYPLITIDGCNLGTLCVIDKKTKKLSTAEKHILKSLAKLIMNQIELEHVANISAFNYNRVMNIFAHDLKNPLAAINMSTDILLNKKDDPQTVMKISQHIKKAGKKSLQLITELLESLELDSTESDLDKSHFNMAELLEEIINTNEILAQRKAQTFNRSIETQRHIFADKKKVTEIIDHLISNAIKFSPKEKQITVTLKEKDEHFLLEVKDDGLGLTETDKKNIFNRFSRVSSQPTGDEISTGMGLYIVKCLVNGHNGEIWVESAGKNKGSTFSVRLPMGAH